MLICQVVLRHALNAQKCCWGHSEWLENLGTKQHVDRDFEDPNLKIYANEEAVTHCVKSNNFFHNPFPGEGEKKEINL